jgi:hypothetical protein
MFYVCFIFLYALKLEIIMLLKEIAITYISTSGIKAAIVIVTENEYNKFVESMTGDITSPLIPLPYLTEYVKKQKGADLNKVSIPGKPLLDIDIKTDSFFEAYKLLSVETTKTVLEYFDLDYGSFVDAYAGHLKILFASSS